MTDRLRILHAIRSDGFAGVEQFVLRLAMAQAEGGHDVAVIGGAAARMLPGLEEAGVPHIAAARTAQVYHSVRRLAGTVDVVNTHMTAADAAAAAVKALRPRRHDVVVATRHFAKPRGRIGPVPIGALLRPYIDGQISISESVAAAIDGASTVVHPGVQSRPLGDGRPRDRIILMAQRLEPEKHTHVGIGAFAASGLAENGWTLDVAGTGSERNALEKLVTSLGLRRSVRFTGFHADLPQVMDRAGILLAPCPVEGFGLTLLEAMAGGLPVVAAAAGGHVEMLEGLDTRSMFSPDDVGEAGHHLRSLAHDQHGLDALSRALWERQQRKFSIRAQVEATEAVYREVM